MTYVLLVHLPGTVPALTLILLSGTSTEAEFREFVSQHFFPAAPTEVLAPLFDLYANVPADGSPFETGDANQLAPEFKRMAALQGDIIFQAPRRFFLDQRSLQQNAWTYSTSTRQSSHHLPNHY